ncbi:MAG: hypothetical protein WAW90_00900 [Minisyncoccia bacterium]
MGEMKEAAKGPGLVSALVIFTASMVAGILFGHSILPVFMSVVGMSPNPYFYICWDGVFGLVFVVVVGYLLSSRMGLEEPSKARDR